MQTPTRMHLEGLPSREAAALETRETLSEKVHRIPARWLVRRLIDTRVTPIHITVMSGFFGFAAGMLMIAGAHYPPLHIAGGLALLLSCILDCADGELARARSRYSMFGMMLDGLADNVVGTSVFVAMAYNIVVYTGDPWMWLLGVAAGLCAGAHTWVFDGKRKQYLNCLGLAQPQEVKPVSDLQEQRQQALARGHRFDAFLLSAYIFFRRTQSLGVTATMANDPVRFWHTNRPKMRAWTMMGSSLHFFCLYVAAFIAPFWPPAFLACALVYAAGLNLIFVWLLIAARWDVG